MSRTRSLGAQLGRWLRRWRGRRDIAPVQEPTLLAGTQQDTPQDPTQPVGLHAPPSTPGPEAAPAQPAAAPAADSPRDPPQQASVAVAAANPKASEAGSRTRRWFRSSRTAEAEELPIRLIIGFLPEVSQRDALQYARGVAERYCESLAIAYVDVLPYGTGYAYEVQEGGPGRALLPAIVEHFRRLGPYEQGRGDVVVLRTATRRVRVERTRDGLSAVLLPEGATDSVTEGLQPAHRMLPVLSTHLQTLVIGGVTAISGVLAFGVANLSRYQPYEPPPPPRVERIDLERTPVGQWHRLLTIPEDQELEALVFEAGVWQVKTAPRGAGRSTETRAP